MSSAHTFYNMLDLIWIQTVRHCAGITKESFEKVTFETKNQKMTKACKSFVHEKRKSLEGTNKYEV